MGADIVVKRKKILRLIEIDHITNGYELQQKRSGVTNEIKKEEKKN